MKLATIASFMLSCISLGSTQVEGTYIKIKNGKKEGKKTVLPFGSKVVVKFEVDRRDLNDRVYVGFFQNDKNEEFYDRFIWQHTCGKQHYLGDDSSCKEGTITFDAKDPDEDGEEQWPLPPGNWQVCLMDESNFYPGDKLDCERLKVLPMDEEDIEASWVKPTRKRFRKGAPITATFYSPKPMAKQWIGLYPTYYLKGRKSELDWDGYHWIYTGCNNQSGNQDENNDCSIMKKSGEISFEASTIDRYYEEGDPYWADRLYFGKYKLCLVFDYNEPYKQFTCSDDFRIVRPAVKGS